MAHRIILKQLKRVKAETPGLAIAALGKVENVKQVIIGYPVELTSEFCELQQYIERRLKDRGHLSSDQIILALINVFISFARNSPQPDRKLDLLLDNMCRSKMKLLYAIKGKGPVADILFDSFRIGNLNYDQFSEFIIKQTQSDYHILQRTELSNSLALEQKPRNIVTLNMSEVSNELNHSDEVKFCLDYYFESLRFKLFETFFDEFEAESKLTLSVLGVFFDPELFLRFNMGQCIAICYRIDGMQGQGWVNGATARMVSMTFQSSERIREANDLTKILSEAINRKSSFSTTLTTLIHFMATAELLAHKRNMNEAFLNFIVGLDSIFNQDTDKANSFNLKSRVAAITHFALKRSYAQQFAIIARLYTSRSEFVHGGIPITDMELTDIREICREVVMVLVRLTNSNIHDISTWLGNLDEISNQKFRSIATKSELLKSNGIFC